MNLVRFGLASLILATVAQARTPDPCARVFALHGQGLSSSAIASTLAGEGVADADADAVVARCMAQLVPELGLEDLEEEEAADDVSSSADEAASARMAAEPAAAIPMSAPTPRPSPSRSSSRTTRGPAKKSAAAPMAEAARRMPVSPPHEQYSLADRDSNTEHYTDYGVNALVLTADDAQSTFAVDVDAASYTLTRSKLNGGMLPDIAAVRVEEFVNYLPYDYDAPSWTADTPFAVHLEAAPSPFTPQRHVLRVGVKGKASAPDRRPAHLTFLVDTSCSMSGPNKLPMAQAALHTLVDNLGIEDTVALATYAGSTRKVLDPTPVTRKERIHAAIDALQSSGGTAMSSGMDLAYDMADAAFLPGGINRVIVLSDGDANIGPATHDQILANIAKYADKGITMTTIGLGAGNYKDTMMEQLANKGDGNYYYLDSQKEAERVFGTHVAGTLDVIARDVKLQVEFDPEVVRAYRLIGYENRDIADRDFRNDAVDAGEIGAEHAVTALYEVVLRDGARTKDLATVRVRAKRPGPDRPAREWQTGFDRSAMASSFGEASDDLRVAFAAATFAELLRDSPHVEEVKYSDVARILRGVERGYAEDAELLGLVETAGRLSGEGMAVTAWR